MNGEKRTCRVEIEEELIRIGAEERQRRQRAGLTQRALEALTGIDQTTISKMERGRLPGLRMHHLARIRLACRTGKHVGLTYGPRESTQRARELPPNPLLDDARLIYGSRRSRQACGALARDADSRPRRGLSLRDCRRGTSELTSRTRVGAGNTPESAGRR